ncbi:hypothetical protein NIES39_D02280 [Arthrospira platensis NIES-39]|nr:hypothetical protein NIES39_D02280 [Arthrospira platensis NIES-39]
MGGRDGDISLDPYWVHATRSISLIIDGWQWSYLGSRFYLTPSVPRFNLRL